MIRFLLAAGLLIAATIAAHAEPLQGDFECLSDHAGPETYHGTMRVETVESFGWLDPDTATLGQLYPIQVLADGQVILGQGFAEHIVPGAFFLTGWFNEDTFTYEASITTADRVLDVLCTYVY